MARTSFSGPIRVIGTATYPPETDSNPEQGPSYFRHGAGILDPRFVVPPGGDVYEPDYLWWGIDRVRVMDGVPSAIAANNIATSQAVTTAVPMTLVAASGAGITIGSSVINALTGVLVTGLLVIDGAPGSLYVGPAAASVLMYDPSTFIARNIRITTNADDSAGFYNVAGFDVYGFPMTEKIAGVSSGVASGKKAFKFVQSITPSGTVASTGATVGTGDVYGFALRVGLWGSVQIFWNSAFITSNTGFVLADATTPATNVTGDVRGTYAVQSASDGTKRFEIFVTPEPSALDTVGLFGVQQV